MRTAFKDWAVIVEALGAGKQILIFRKGGIREARGGFKVEHEEFLLFPTLFHQQKNGLAESAKGYYEGLEGSLHKPEEVPIQYWCKVVDWRILENEEDALRFNGQHIWSETVLKERFDWGRDKGIYVMALRVHRLPRPVLVPLIPSYAGCKSWIQLEQNFDTEGSMTVLGDETFELQLESFRKVLEKSKRD
ncbi:MAG: hypothetical protein JWN25_1570 [Verrucomicrobiales bacterium]|nr:hypothetical protein [Verrucomicrobiales bacterium]